MAPIHSAARRGNLNRVKALLNQGVPVNTQTDAGWTPLHDAADSGRLNVVQELLRRGARVNIRTHQGSTPLNVAAFGRHPHVVHALQEARAREIVHGHLSPPPRARSPSASPRRVRPRTGIPAYNNFNINHITVAPRAPSHTPNYSKTVKSVAKKFLMGPSRNVFLNKNGKPRNGNGPVNLNFNRGNYGIQYTRRWMSNGTNKSVRFYYSVPTFERLVGAKWSSIRHKAPTHVVLKRIPHLPPPKKDERQTAVYRRNLALVKFI